MKHYSDIIIAPVITEKSMVERQNNVYTFKVAKDATKDEIKFAVEEAFKVSVKKVNTLNTKAKRRRVGRFTGKSKTYKKAIVTLAEGSSIDL
ncbi:MAG: 50S ribosomal protein L23 [Bacilli bacterium]|nr:50S ribosomal protein L23 [Bacilli bacterium]MBQ8901792.1 50S ribosomal protein L23 [Bacilli bacterium]